MRDTVAFLRNWDFTRFYGILDRDSPPNENKPDDGLFVLTRNGVESYLFDALNVWLCLWMFKPELHAQRLHRTPALRQGSGHQFKSMPIDELQAAADSVFEVVRPHLDQSHIIDDEKIDVDYLGGKRLRYPKWAIDYDDHALAAAIRKSFSPYPFPDRDLRESFMTLALPSQELWDIFEQIARGGTPEQESIC